jgi:hypothetical protein
MYDYGYVTEYARPEGETHINRQYSVFELFQSSWLLVCWMPDILGINSLA